MSAQKVGKFFLLWVVIPATLGALGYFVVGPNLVKTQTFTKTESETEALKRELEEANKAETEGQKPKDDRSYAR